MLSALKVPIVSMFFRLIKTPVWVDARIVAATVIVLSLIQWPPVPASSMRPVFTSPVVVTDTIVVTVPADSLTEYILQEIRKVEAKMQADCTIVANSQNPFEIATFELFRREGYSPTVYVCPAGRETIGFGDVVDTEAERVFRSNGMPFSTARAKLYANFKTGADEISRRFPGVYKSPNQWIALCLLGHSIGWDRLQKRYPEFYQEIQMGRPSGRWLKYCYFKNYKTGRFKKSANLVRTRNTEWLLFNGDFDGLAPYYADAARVAKTRWDRARVKSLETLGIE